MHRFSLEWSEPLAEEYREEIERRIFFVSEEIREFRFDIRDGLIRGIELTIETSDSEVDVEAKVRAVVSQEVASQRPSIPQVTWRSSVEEASIEPVFDDLEREGI